MAFDKNVHLSDVLESYKMKHIQIFLDKVNIKRDEIKEKLSTHYGSNKYSSFNSGSMAKHTATNLKFDVDVVEPFKHSSFATLEEMFNDVYNYLKGEYGNQATVRRQKVSIGIEFPKEDDDIEPIQLDIVPGRELNDDEYPNTHDLNLYFNEDHWGFKKGSRQKTNIYKQIEYIKGKSEERKIIRLLKTWKKHHNKNYKSFMLELFCIKSLQSYTGENKIWDCLKYTMEYIKDNIENESFNLVDPGNSSNNVLSIMDSFKRTSLKNEMISMLSNIESNDSSYLPYYFPENEKYAVKSEEEGYESSENQRTVSYPRTPQRFGKE